MSEPRKISCSIRCLDGGVVARARERLADAPLAVVPYVCKVSGQREEIVLLAEATAAAIAARTAGLRDPLDALLAAAVLRTDLCECDLAALAGRSEADVLAHLDRLEAAGVMTRRVVDRMNYYGLGDGGIRDEMAASLAPHLPDR